MKLKRMMQKYILSSNKMTGKCLLVEVFQM